MSKMTIVDRLREPHSDDHEFISTFLRAVYEWRNDVKDAFPLDKPEGQINLIRWWLEWGIQSYPGTFAALGVTNEFLASPLAKKFKVDWSIPHETEGRSKEKQDNFDVNVIGFSNLKIGIGEDARIFPLVIEKAGFTHTSTDLNGAELGFGRINIYAIPAPSILAILPRIPQSEFNSSINIASCHWELPIWPSTLNFIFDLFDEVWVYTDFVFNSIDQKYRNKLRKMPLPVITYGKPLPDKKKYGLKSDVFYFLFSFDFASHVTRKNPMAVVEAFRVAFGSRHDVGLVIKTNNSEAKKTDFEKFESEIKKAGINCSLITDVLVSTELHNLYASIDAFVSLHRSEGFGRNITEMMLLGKPVIVTNFSGNVDFTNTENSFLVDYELKKLSPGDYIYSENQFWAEPKIDSAAEQLRLVYENPELRLKKAALAREFVERHYSIDGTAKVWQSIIQYFLDNSKTPQR